MKPFSLLSPAPHPRLPPERPPPPQSCPQSPPGTAQGGGVGRLLWGPTRLPAPSTPPHGASWVFTAPLARSPCQLCSVHRIPVPAVGLCLAWKTPRWPSPCSGEARPLPPHVPVLRGTYEPLLGLFSVSLGRLWAPHGQRSHVTDSCVVPALRPAPATQEGLSKSQMNDGVPVVAPQ